MTPIFGLAGLSGSGKTTLLCAILPKLIARGYTVSTIKHAHHQFDVDREGKDSFRHRAGGATEVLVSSRKRWALMHENHGDIEADLQDLISHMSPVDLILVEGFKAQEFPKIFLHRAEFYPTLKAQDLEGFSGIVAIATNAPTAVSHDIPYPLLPLDDHDSLIACIEQSAGLQS